ncbi:MAG: NAD-dependent epimerase/dehydratase family protein [Ktedonobacteraceae bacterium]|nr:NAD-dependent epimerase/dehydratase family protein [Ktedonobacteraceae bacterium]
MQVFVLGATGWIGGAITDMLLESHHQVIGLARNAQATSKLEAKGATAVQGDMDDATVLLPIAKKADAIVMASSASLDTTMTTLQALVTALQGSLKPLIYISGSSLYGDIGNQEQVDEQVFVQQLTEPSRRQSPEQIVYQARELGIHGMVVVGAGILYGRGGGATPNFLLDDARQRNAAWYIGAGTQRWSAVHVEDMARLTVLALEQKPSQPVFNAVAEALPLRNVAETIAQATHAGGGAQSISEQAAQSSWGSFWAGSLPHNLWLSPKRAEHTLGWKLSAPSFNDDLLYGSYKERA